MSNGLGAGFATVTLLATLLVLAVLLVVTAAVALLSRRRRDSVPAAVVHEAVCLLGVVLVVAGFGVLALADEAPPAAALLLALVFVPLGGAVVVLRRAADRGLESTVATAAMAWRTAFLAGVAVLFVFVAGIEPALGLATWEARRVGLPWIETALAGLIALAGATLLDPRLGERLPHRGGAT